MGVLQLCGTSTTESDLFKDPIVKEFTFSLLLSPRGVAIVNWIINNTLRIICDK